MLGETVKAHRTTDTHNLGKNESLLTVIYISYPESEKLEVDWLASVYVRFNEKSQGSMQKMALTEILATPGGWGGGWNMGREHQEGGRQFRQHQN